MIPVDTIDWELVEAESSANGSFLGDSWIHPAEWNPEKGAGPMPFKANTFMASESRIDDDRMMKVCQGGQNKGRMPEFELARYSVGHHKWMLGLPANYIKGPIDALFQKLQECFKSSNWTLDEDCHVLKWNPQQTLSNVRVVESNQTKLDWSKKLEEEKLGLVIWGKQPTEARLKSSWLP